MNAGKPLHVLHVIGGLQLGGAETLLYRLAIGDDDNVRHEVICLGARDWYSEPLERHGVTVHHLEMVTPTSFLRGIPGFARLVRRLRPDVIQAWMYLSNILSGVFARTAGIPVIWGIHASTLEHVRGASLLCANAGGLGARWLTDHVVNCSARSADFHARKGYGRVPGTVIHNGYDSKAFGPDPEARDITRKSLGIEPGQFLLGTVSRWHPEKDIPTLLAALAILRDNIPQPKILLVGIGLDEANPALEQAMRDHGVAEDIACPLGRRSDVADLARAIDLHVLPSAAEAFPNVIAETMLSGTPNAVTNVGDSATIVGDTGWVVPPRRPDLLADAIAQAYGEWRDQPTLWDERRASARERIASNFTAAAMRASYERVWRAAAGRTR